MRYLLRSILCVVTVLAVGDVAWAQATQPGGGGVEADLEAAQARLVLLHADAVEAVASGDPAEAGLRLTQLRGAAERTRRLRTTNARAVGGYWLLVAELMEIERGVEIRSTQEADAEEGVSPQVQPLRAFREELAHEEQTPLVSAMRVAVDVSLTEQLHRDGRVEEACGVLGDLRERLAPSDPAAGRAHAARRHV